jgi:chalcone isomerase-like protein
VKSIYRHTIDASLFSRRVQKITSTKAELSRSLAFRTIGRRMALAIGLAAGLCAVLPQSALAAQDCHAEIPAAQLSGSGEYRFLGLHLYDAQLWSTHLPVSFDARFALQLTYTTSATRERLATLGLNEMKRLAPTPLPDSLVARWRDDMLKAFVDVAPGDWLCGVFLPGTGVRFFANGAPTATIEDPEFARAFFNIWFDPGTRAKTLRAKLLGGS